MKNKKVGNGWVILVFIFLTSPLVVLNAQEKKSQDWANLARYERENASFKKKTKSGKRIVFMGNSITEGWAKAHPVFFQSNGYIGRGISGQTSSQFLLRFRSDVINLNPDLVVINAATNDIAENTGVYKEDVTFGNIVSMVELARANKIKVVLTTTLPAAAFRWNPAITDAPQKIRSLNNRLSLYAEINKIPFVDYYAALLSADGISLNPLYTKDGVHPTSEGYAVMEQIIKEVIE